MTMAIMVLVSAYHFHVQLTFHAVCGVASILVTTYMYMHIAIKLPKPPRQEGAVLSCLRKQRLWEHVGLVEADDTDEPQPHGAPARWRRSLLRKWLPIAAAASCILGFVVLLVDVTASTTAG